MRARRGTEGNNKMLIFEKALQITDVQSNGRIRSRSSSGIEKSCWSIAADICLDVQAKVRGFVSKSNNEYLDWRYQAASYQNLKKCMDVSSPPLLTSGQMLTKTNRGWEKFSGCHSLHTTLLWTSAAHVITIMWSWYHAEFSMLTSNIVRWSEKVGTRLEKFASSLFY